MSVSKNAKTTGRTGFTLRTALRELIRTIPDVVYFKDKNRRYLVVNEAFVELCGLTNAEIIGKTDETIFPADLAASFRASDGRVFESGTVFRFEDAVRDPRGRRIVFETIKSPFRSASGNVAGILGISRDITARRRMEEALRESEERFRTLYENATVGLYRTTPEGRILLANPALFRLLGYETFEEIASRDLEREGYGPGYSRAAFKERLERDGFIQGLETAWKRKDGTTVYVRESARLIRSADGASIYYEGTVEDITERKRAELELRTSEEKYRRIFDRSLEGILQTSLDGRILAANRALVRMFGYASLEEFLSVNMSDLYVDLEARDYMIESLRAGDEVRNLELRMRRKDGAEFYALMNVTALRDPAGRIERIEGMLTDITDLIQSRADLESALREKEVLLKEIYHRIKNNLQTVSALLGLQGRCFQDPETVRAFAETQDRLRSMAMIHESLYRSDRLSGVDFPAYVRNLAQALIGAQETSPGRIKLRLDVEPVSFDLKTAVPLGLIINELVSNALKHGFPRDREGTISVELHRRGEDGFHLSIRDDGIGLPPDLELGRLDSMGLCLVEMLTGQIDGRLRLGSAPGANFEITFRAEVS